MDGGLPLVTGGTSYSSCLLLFLPTLCPATQCLTPGLRRSRRRLSLGGRSILVPLLVIVLVAFVVGEVVVVVKVLG